LARFSVGIGEGALEFGALEAGVLGVVVGASFSVPELQDVSAPIATMAAPPAKIAIRLVKRPELMMCPLC
jgi:hypothetical protein